MLMKGELGLLFDLGGTAGGVFVCRVVVKNVEVSLHVTVDRNDFPRAESRKRTNKNCCRVRGCCEREVGGTEGYSRGHG
jgi:hypothetical protein